jgi:L-ascorbate metabolism protein UlaG (beta-lactamase superfamily)
MKKHSKESKLKLTWFGHSAFLMESTTGKKVLIDAWLNNPKAPEGAKDSVTADIILVTHGHSDHIGNTVEIAKRTNANVVSIFEISKFLTQAGVANVNGINKGGSVTIDGITITMTDAVHSSDIDEAAVVVPGGQSAGYVIRFENGFTVYHSGDTALFGDMKLIQKLYKPDVALIPIGGYYTMGPKEAAKAVELINPKYSIGMHYGTFPLLAGTPAELKKNLTAKLKKTVLELKPGVTLELK